MGLFSKKVEPKKPVPPLSDSIGIGSYLYARYSGDGFFYFGKIVAENKDGVSFHYYDDFVETVSWSDLREVGYCVGNMKAQGNWENRGYFYPCTIQNVNLAANRFIVRYTQDGVIEQAAPKQIRFEG